MDAQQQQQLRIRAFEAADEAAAIALWRDCGLLRPWNDPHKDIARKLQVQPELFLVATLPQAGAPDLLIGTAMAGYDGTAARCTTWRWRPGTSVWPWGAA